MILRDSVLTSVLTLLVWFIVDSVTPGILTFLFFCGEDLKLFFECCYGSLGDCDADFAIVSIVCFK